MADSPPNVVVHVEVVVPSSQNATQKRSQWRERIHNFSWQWHVIVMATGVCSSLLQNFPYHNGSPVLKIMALVFFLLDLVIFIILCAWTVTRCVMFSEDWSKILTDPAKSLFVGFFANGAAALINAGLAVNNDWGTGGTTFLYSLWALWWLDCTLSCLITFGLVYIMMGQNSRDMSKVGPVWMVPIITMITISSSGSLFTRALLPHSGVLPLISVAISASMLLIGLSFTMMFTTAFLLRLYLYGPLDSRVVLTTFTTLTPLGLGGYSLLSNGRDLADLLPIVIQGDLPDNPLVGKIIFSICFCAAYALWSMGLAWIVVACFSIARRASTLPAFCISHWCVIVPNGGYALLSVQMGNVLDSPFFHAFGALWSCIVFFLWTIIFLRTIPALFDGSIFRPVGSTDNKASAEVPIAPKPLVDEEKASPEKRLEVLKEHDSSSESVADTLCTDRTITASPKSL